MRNVGASAGKEVVQLYVSAPDGVADQPYQELRGYAKTRELHARESEMLEITVRASDLSSFDETQSAYVLAAGTYWLRIGTSSDAAKIVAGLRLERVYTLTDRGEAHAAAADAAGTKYYQYATAIPIGTALAQS